MKKIIITVALLIGASAATPSFAENGRKIVNVIEIKEVNDVSIKPLQNMKFKLVLSNTQERTEVSLINGDGNVLFNEYATSTEGYKKVFDLSNLSDGSYSFVIRTGSEKTVKTFEITTNLKRSVEFQTK